MGEQTGLSLWRVAALAVVLAASSGAGPVAAPNPAGPAAPVDDPNVRLGAEAFQQTAGFPWYDPATDGLRPLDVVPRRPPTSTSWSFSFFDFLSAIAEPILWLTVTAGLLLLGWVLVRFWLAREKSTVTTVENVERLDHSTVIEALPLPARTARGDLLARARQHYERGEFNDAIVFFYSHLLVALDQAHLIGLARGKTNRQYLRELSGGPLRGVLETVMVAFEDAFFGKHALDRPRFESCWQLLAEFDAEVARRLAAREQRPAGGLA